jgi:hypothetical protein
MAIDLLKPVRKLAGKFMCKGGKPAPEVYRRRLAICMGCPKLIKLTKSCSICGCFVDEKSNCAPEKCPLGKW